MKAMKTGFPFRFADMWLIDAPWYLYFLWFALWCFMSPDLRSKVHLVSSKVRPPKLPRRARHAGQRRNQRKTARRPPCWQCCDGMYLVAPPRTAPPNVRCLWACARCTLWL